MKNLLIILEGNHPNKPESSFIEEFDSIYLLYLHPHIKAAQYKDDLRALVKKDLLIEIINPRKIVDFYSKRNELLDFIASLPQRLKIGRHNLSEFLCIHGLNMWWTSDIVEAMPYKQSIFQNFYYLSAVKYLLENIKIDEVWFQVNDQSFCKDLVFLFDKANIKHYQEKTKPNRAAKSIKDYVLRIYERLFPIFAEIGYSIAYKLLKPDFLEKDKKNAGTKKIHLFHSSYPYNWKTSAKTNNPEHKIYGDLPFMLEKHLGGNSYYLSAMPFGFISDLGSPLREVKKLWKEGIRVIPMSMFISLKNILTVYLSPLRYWKYFRLKQASKYSESFNISGINMFYTFNFAMRESLLGSEARTNLLCFYAYRNFTRRYADNIFQIIYYLEFHSWEPALITGVRSVDKSLPVIGLQQSAINPILLNFFLAPSKYISKENGGIYPLPDLILCYNKLYKELIASKGIDLQKIEAVGFLAGENFKEFSFSKDLKIKTKKQLNIPLNKIICLVACSVTPSITEAIMYIISLTAAHLPEVVFLIKGHPDNAGLIKSFIGKYNMDMFNNINYIDGDISILLPLSDCLISTNTTVAQEALWEKIPQINLNLGGLPYDNPLHIMPGLIKDVETSDELIKFINNHKSYAPADEDRDSFLTDTSAEPSQKALNIIINKFHLKKL